MSESTEKEDVLMDPPEEDGEGNQVALLHAKFNEILDRLSLGLSIPRIITQSISDKLPDVISSHTLKNDETTICACLLYAGLLNHRYASDRPEGLPTEELAISASDLFCDADITVPEFFTTIQELQECYQFSNIVMQKVSRLKKKYLIVSPLFVKFEKMFDDLFLKEDDPTNPASTTFSEMEGYSFKKKLCWTLFIYAKAILMKGNQELVTAFHLLLSCINYVISVTPSFQLKPPVSLLRQTSVESLPELCTQYAARLEEVRSQETSLLHLVHDLPQDANTLNLWRLQDAYSELYRKEGDIDELMFLSHHSHLTQVNKIPLSEPTESPQPPQTPVSAALNTVKQLQDLLNTSPDRPSQTLLGYFQECPSNPLASIEERLALLRDKFVTAFWRAMGQNHEETGQQRFTLTIRLYYRVMESLLKMEEVRLQRRDFPHLLHSNVFHTSLCACAAIVVMATYSNHSASQLLERRTAHMSLFVRPPFSLSLSGEDSADMQFPWILDVFGLKGYDFYKMIESFIRAEPKLTKDIIKHLQEIENKVLERIAWESSSPLYQALSTSVVPAPSAQVPERPATASTSDLFMSPVRGMETVTYEATQGSPRSPSPRRSQTLNNFYNKLCRLSYHRLQNLCAQLDITNDLQQRIWTCLEYCFSNFWTLMKDRHIDQLMMCAVYAICRVQDMEIKFKRIVNVYSNMPHATADVYKHVLIQGTERSSIIMFYNDVFIRTLKAYILQFADPKQPPSMSPVPKNMSSPLTASPVYSVPGRKNFFVSPMKNSPFKSPLTPGRMTPRTRQLYSFGEGSAEKLKLINESVRSAQRLTSPVVCRSQKRLQFDQMEGGMANDDSGDIIIKKMRKSLKYDMDMKSEQASTETQTSNSISRSAMLALSFDDNNTKDAKADSS